MIFLELDKNNYIVKIPNNKLNDIDIFNPIEVETFIKELFSKIIKKYNLKGEVDLNI